MPNRQEDAISLAWPVYNVLARRVCMNMWKAEYNYQHVIWC